MQTRLFPLVVVLVPITLFAWLLYKDINPTGLLAVRYEMGQTSPYVDHLLPAERVSGVQSQDGDRFVKITDEPVYFALHTPTTPYDEVEVELVFRPDGQSLVEFGPRIDVFAQAYDLAPAYHGVIESIDWFRVQEGGTTLLQRTKDFRSVTDFLRTPPSTSRIATYAYEFEQPYREPGYTPLGHDRVIDVSLRGFHKYVTYIKNEPLVTNVIFMDMNRTVGADEVVLRVIDEDGDIVFEESHGDDLNKNDNQISSTRTASIVLPDLREGVYTVELSGTSDIFWREIKTPQRYVTFVNQLYIGDDVGHKAQPRGSVFYTNAKNFAMETFHADATQVMNIGERQIALSKSHEKVFVSIAQPGLLTGGTPAGDVKMVGDGKFAFSRDAFFDPDPVRLGAQTDLDVRGVDYILTTYTPPSVDEDGWSHAFATFPIAGSTDEEGAMTFTISTPFIVAQQGEVDVHEIAVQFFKEPLSPSEVWQALLDRLPFGL